MRKLESSPIGSHEGFAHQQGQGEALYGIRTIILWVTDMGLSENRVYSQL